MRLLPDESIDIVVTDPPYLINYKTNHRKDKDHKFCTEIANDGSDSISKDFIANCIHELYRVLKNDSAMYMFCSSKTQDFFKACCKDAGFTIKNTIIWVKNNWTAGDLTAQFGQSYEVILLLNKGRREFIGKRLSDVWYFDRVSSGIHQNQKPVELVIQCLLKHSEDGDIVLDPFMGSGTTAEACIKTNRRYIGYELDPVYYKQAQKRIAAIGQPQNAFDENI